MPDVGTLASFELVWYHAIISGESTEEFLQHYSSGYV